MMEDGVEETCTQVIGFFNCWMRKNFSGTAREAEWSFKGKGGCNAEMCAEWAVQEGGERRRRRTERRRGRKGEV